MTAHSDLPRLFVVNHIVQLLVNLFFRVTSRDLFFLVVRCMLLLLNLISFDLSLIAFLLLKLELVCQRSLGFEEWQFVWNVQVRV